MNQGQQQPQQGPQGSQNVNGASMMAPNQVPAHLMGLMTNPALAAAAAASPLFPPAAMLSNPGAFLHMPEAFANGANSGQQQAGTTNQHVSAPGGAVLPRMSFGGDGSQMNPQTQQQQHRQGMSPVPGSALSASGLGNMGMTGFGQQNGTMQQQQQQQAQQMQQQQRQQVQIIPGDGSGNTDDSTNKRAAELSTEERAKQNRDRNREHARSTRLRKKAYVQKLKELVEGLHAERTEEVRQRRVAIQHLAEMQNVRRGVVRSFLKFHSSFETNPRKWETILEDNFWLKQPVTPYRSFRRTEIEQDCRITRGAPGMVADAASVSVMVEEIGSRSTRWMQIKREEFFFLEESKRGPAMMPQSIVRQDSRLQHAVSSLSSSSGSSSGSASVEAGKERKQAKQEMFFTGKDKAASDNGADAKKVSSSSGSSSDSGGKQQAASKDFHDYHAKPLPDPKLGDSGSTSPSEDSPEESNNSSNDDRKRVCTDSSSGDDSAAAIAAPRDVKRRRTDSGRGAQDTPTNGLPPNIAKSGGITANGLGVTDTSIQNGSEGGTSRMSLGIPGFAGIGKSSAAPSGSGPSGGSNAAANAPMGEGSAIVTADVETSSNNSSEPPQIRAYYHMNEDDMILMEDVLMCPFIFRSQDAVVCGALAECVMPGMFRAHFSTRNKLNSVEMVYDAMGFMQQLERASGSERTAQIIPGSLEMALSPSSTEARVITLAEPPFLIVNVNEVWTRLTKYTQMEAEGREFLALLEGERTLPDAGERQGKPRHKFEDVAKGLSACSTNIHYNKDGRDFVDFVSSYPLTNANDEITHLLHISKELPALPESVTEH